MKWEPMDPKAIELLMTDPVEYYARTRRQPFGFAPPARKDAKDSK